MAVYGYEDENKISTLHRSDYRCISVSLSIVLLVQQRFELGLRPQLQVKVLDDQRVLLLAVVANLEDLPHHVETYLLAILILFFLDVVL